MEQIYCPYCKSDKIAVTTVGNITKTAASFGGACVEGVVKGAANELLFEGAGRFMPKFGSRLAALASVEYVCHSCDCLFKALVSADGVLKESRVTKEPMPDKIIENVRENYIAKLREKRPYASMAIFAFLTLFCLVSFLIGVAEDNGLRIVGSIFFAVPFMIPAIIKWKKIGELNKEVEDCENQSLREFKVCHRSLFSQYSQYH